MTILRQKDRTSRNASTSMSTTTISNSNSKTTVHSHGTKIRSSFAMHHRVHLKNETTKNKRQHRRSNALLIGGPTSTEETLSSSSPRTKSSIPSDSVLSLLFAEVIAEGTTIKSDIVSSSSVSPPSSRSTSPVVEVQPRITSPSSVVTLLLCEDDVLAADCCEKLQGCRDNMMSIKNSQRCLVPVKPGYAAGDSAVLNDLNDTSRMEIDEDKTSKLTSFANDATVVEIPARHEYSEEQKLSLWNGATAIGMMARKNAVEYRWEGNEWRNAVEEDCFLVSRGGERVHPAHIQPQQQYHHLSYHPVMVQNHGHHPAQSHHHSMMMMDINTNQMYPYPYNSSPPQVVYQQLQPQPTHNNMVILSQPATVGLYH